MADQDKPDDQVTEGAPAAEERRRLQAFRAARRAERGSDALAPEPEPLDELARIRRKMVRDARRAGRDGVEPAAPAPRILMLSCMKNEGATILEWVAYHRAIGVDHFLVYTNDCDDGTDLIWQRLEQMGLASHLDNPATRRLGRYPPQARAYARAVRHPAYAGAEWVLVLDADEFLNIHTGQGRIDDLLAQNPDADCFMITWRLFGSSGMRDYARGFVLDQFRQAALPDRVTRSHAMAPKSIFRRARFSQANIHRPALPQDGGERLYCAPSGQPISRQWGSVARQGNYDHAQINHYSIQSMDMLLLKFARGFAAKAETEDPAVYLRTRDFNHAPDETILRHLPAVRAEYDRLLADPILARLQRAAEDWRLRKLAEAMAVPELAATKSALVAAQSALMQAAQTGDTPDAA